MLSSPAKQPTDPCRYTPGSTDEAPADCRGSDDAQSIPTPVTPDGESLFDMSPEWRRALQSLASVPGLNVFAYNASSHQLRTSEGD